MDDKNVRKLIHQAVDTRSPDLHPNPYMAQRVLEQAHRNGEIKVKKKLSLGFIVMMVVILAAVTAVAVTVLDDLKAVWQDSFERMNTTGVFDAVEKDEFDLKGFEKEYAENTGNDRKDDLIISTVPDENNLSYEEAYAIARSKILDTYGTPEAELDAMGIYPTYYETVYNDDVNEWDFYFTARRDVDINEDHSYDAPGEYRVYIDSPSGEVTFCNWYNDDFWPEYAKRTWEAGKHDYVYGEAKRSAFFEQSAEDQAYFIAQFKAEGYDVSEVERSIEDLLASADLELMFSEVDQNLLHSDDVYVDAALKALESTYGLTADMLESYGFCAVYSPYAAATKDVCFAHNYNIVAERIESGAITDLENKLISYSSRLGMFMIRIDPDTMQAVETVHCDRELARERATDESLLLGRRNWTSADLPLFDEMMAQAKELAAKRESGELTWVEADILFDQLMRENGGDPDIYSRHTMEEEGYTREGIVAEAVAAVAKETGLTEAEINKTFTSQELYYEGRRVFDIYFYPQSDNPSGWYVCIDKNEGTTTVRASEGHG